MAYDPQQELDQIFREQGLLEKTDKRYSLKWVERAVLAVLGLVGLAIVTKFLALVNLPPPPTP